MNSCLTLIACTTAVACVAASIVQFRRTSRRALGSPKEVLLVLTRGKEPGRRARPAADLAWQFVGAVLAAPSGPARVATLNEWLLVIERLTGNLDVVPRAAARIALFTGFGCAVLAVARMPSGAVYVSASIWSVCAGLSGTVLCGYFGRLASRAAREARRDYNRLAERLMDETHVC